MKPLTIIAIVLMAGGSFAQSPLDLPESKSDLPLENDPDRIVIDITAPAPTAEELRNPKVAERWTKARQRKANRIMIGDETFDFKQLSAYLEKRGRLNPASRDPKNPMLSSRAVLIRCEAGQAFDYVKAILQLCAQPKIAIYKIEIAAANDRVIDATLPTDFGTVEKEEIINRRFLHIKMRQPNAADDPRPIRQRSTNYYFGNERFGVGVGGDLTAALGLRIKAHRAAHPDDGFKIETGVGVPHERVVAVMDLAHAAGFKHVVFIGLAANLNVASGTKWWNRIRSRLDKESKPGRTPTGASPKPRRGRPVTRRPTQRAVDGALEWLAKTQSPDGSWSDSGGDRDLRATSLALLAFLGSGETHKVGKHKLVVRGAIKWIRDQQRADGAFTSLDTPQRRADHLVAALAANEAYNLTTSPLFKKMAIVAVEAISSQAPSKPIQFFAGEPPEPELAFWLVLLADSSRNGGLSSEPERVAKLAVWLQSLTDKDTGRTGKSSDPTLTAAFIFGQLRAGKDRDDALITKSAKNVIQKSLPTGSPIPTDRLVAWHAGTIASYQLGGETWRLWNQALATAFDLDSELRFPIGSDEDSGGKVATTALAALSLEVYYRYGRAVGTK